MKIYNNIYKKLLVLCVSIFTCYIQAQKEATEKSIQHIVKKITRRDSKEIDKIDRLIKQKTKSILNALAVDFDALTNRLVDLANNLTALTFVVNNLSIVTQLGLINSSAANAALTTIFVITNSSTFSSEVDIYNAAIITALAAVSTAVRTPSQNNTAEAQSVLALAIADFDMIDSVIAVDSHYSMSEIYKALMKLNVQLEYLYSLQAS